MSDELLASDHSREVGGQGVERAEREIGAFPAVAVLRRQAPHLVGVVGLEPGERRAQARVLERGMRLDRGLGGLAKGDRGITWRNCHGAQPRDRVIRRNDLSQETAMRTARTWGRRPPVWRDPEFPDIDPASHGTGYRKMTVMNELQEERGLPPIANLMRAQEGRPELLLSWWDRKQKKPRGVRICADVVMTPAQWNLLHPAARRRVPRRLLPLGVLGSRLLAPTPTRT